MRNAVDAARAHGITVRLAAPRPQMAKLLRITGLDRSLTICATGRATRTI